MKKRTHTKLQLSRETLRHLNDPQLRKIQAGESVDPICETETCSIYYFICKTSL